MSRGKICLRIETADIADALGISVETLYKWAQMDAADDRRKLVTLAIEKCIQDKERMDER